MRESYGPVADSFRVYRIARDGRILESVANGVGEKGYEAFTYDDRGHLVRRETAWSQDAHRAPHPSRLDRDAASFDVVVEYVYGRDGKKLSARRDGSTETYRWEGDHLVEIRRRGEESYEWQLRWEGSRLVEVRHVANGRVSMMHAYEHDASGRRVHEVFTADFLAHPWSYSYEYDASGLLVARNLVVDGVTVPAQSERIVRDGNGNIVRLSKGDVSTSFSYDEKGRPIRIQRDGDPPRRFEYESGCTPAMTEAILPDPLASIWNPAETL